jgi:2-keto-4-pentenoate hydratase/2-oxohepta-3-ene-1,7-dioic acid hydratase in catechol pathway
MSARPLPPAIICVGRNYADHASEMGGKPPERPVVFFKNPACITGASADIVLPAICSEGGPQVDYEGELAVVIGANARDVSVERALSFVAGYSVANDVSARWWQNHGAGGQFCRGKSFDTFCPLSEPVPASAVRDPQALIIHTRVNGETRQNASTSQMIFSVARLIADLSRGMTLLEGTVILTGSPAGVGHAMRPPSYLRAGDLVEIDIAGVGSLSNRVVDAA